MRCVRRKDQTHFRITQRICSVLRAENGKPVDNALIESYNGRLWDKCLNSHLFWSMEDARENLEIWRLDYNSH